MCGANTGDKVQVDGEKSKISSILARGLVVVLYCKHTIEFHAGSLTAVMFI